MKAGAADADEHACRCTSVLNSFMRPSREFREAAPVLSILRGLRGTQGVRIACSSDGVEMLRSDADILQAARHAEANG